MTTEIEETYARFVKYYMEKFLMVLKRWPVKSRASKHAKAR